MPLDYLQYEVHSYFINVGAGDAAIHLLLKNGQIEKAAIIDGGHEEGYAATNASIPALRERYKQQFQLDTIVITHWDGDHYRSLIKVLYDDFIAKRPNQQTLIKADAYFYCPYTAMAKMTKENTWKVDGDLLYFRVPKKGSEPARDHQICNAVVGTHCIGRDLFSTTPLFNGNPTVTWTAIKSLGDVYTGCDHLRDNKRPVFLIVGADQKFINDGAYTKKDAAPLTVGKGGARQINAASIMAILIWPTSTANQTNPYFRISLYTGGDAEEDRERHLLGWIKPNPNLDNKAFVISAGQKHGHPSYSVLFFLFTIMELRKRRQFTVPLLFATQKPYWIDMPLADLSRVHLNIQTVFSYKDGTGVLFNALAAEIEKLEKCSVDQAKTKLVDIITESLKSALEELYNVYHTNLGGKFPRLSKDGQDGIMALYQPSGNWQPPDLKTLNLDSRYWKAVEDVRVGVKKAWSDFKCQPSTGGNGVVQFIQLKARASGIELNTIYHTLNSKLDQLVLQTAPKHKGNQSLNDKRAPYWDTPEMIGNGKTRSSAKKFKKDHPGVLSQNLALQSLQASSSGFHTSMMNNSSPAETAVSHSRQPMAQEPTTYFEHTNRKPTVRDLEIRQWTLDTLAGDIRQAFSSLKDSKPKKLAVETSGLASWIQTCFPNDDATILVSGQTEWSGEATPEAISIHLASKPHDPSERGTWQLVLTTEETTRIAQFGPDAVTLPSSPLAYDHRFHGLLLAVDSTRTTGTMSLTHFSELIGYNLPPWVTLLLGHISLRPAAAQVLPKTVARDHRSGLWFIPCHNWRVVVRMAMEMDTQQTTGAAAIKGLLEKSGLAANIDVSDVLFTGIRVVETLSDDHIETLARLNFQATLVLHTASNTTPDKTGTVPPLALQDLSVTAGVKFGEDGLEVTLQLNDSSADILAHLLHWGESLVSKGSGSPSSSSLEEKKEGIVAQIESALGTITKGLDVRTIVIGLGTKRDNETETSRVPKPLYFAVNIEVSLPSGNGATEQKQVPFLITLQWSQGVYTVSSSLWHDAHSLEVSPIPPSLRPYHSLGSPWDIQPRTPNRIDNLSIKDLIGIQDLEFPAGVPHVISDAAFEVSFGRGVTTVFFKAGVECPPVPVSTNSAPPALRFDELHLALVLSYIKGHSFDFKLEFDAVTEIRLPPGHEPDPGIDDVVVVSTKIEYERETGQSSWLIAGKVSDVKIANLYELFAADGSNNAIMDVMKGIHIDYVWISYEYHKGQPGRFDLDGTIRLGPRTEGLELNLRFSHVAKPDSGQEPGAEEAGWSFHASLQTVELDASEGLKEKSVKISTLLQDLVDDVNDLPDIVRTMEIPRSALAIDLACSGITTNATTLERYVVFALVIKIKTGLGEFEVTLAQVRSYSIGGNKQNLVPGRLLRFSLSRKGQVSNLPLVGSMSPPFDEMGIVWTSRDITAAEMEVLNSHVFTSHPIQVGLAPAGASFQQGFHFQVALLEGAQPKLILDHAVRKTERKDKGKEKTAATGALPGSKANLTDPGKTSATGKSVAPMTKTFGPLSVKNVGLWVEGDNFSTVKISVDASVKLGPVTFALLGFTLTLDLGSLTHPDHLAALVPTVDLEGMAVSFERPPTRLAGRFRRFDNKTTSRGFQGAIAVSIAAWSALAGGQYEELYPDFITKSFFVFGMLQGPIAEFGCAEINGLTGGFGYNSRLQLPSNASDVVNFPFVALNRTGSREGSILEQMDMVLASGTKQLIAPAKDEMWLVAGLGLKAFQAVDAQAIFALTLGAEPKFTVLATATAVFPKPPTSTALTPGTNPEDQFPSAFLVVDLAISCVIDPFHSTVIATGELTPLSFILHPKCRLTGSFAMAYFLPNSDNAGDFVFSVGGYHPHFQVPSHYPPVRNRVGITWQYDKEVYIQGEAYFAITPSAVMGGGRLDMVVNKSMLASKLSVHVTFSAYADFLMHLHPFSFEASVGICIYARASLSLLFWTEPFGPLEFSASLRLHGPPLGGEAKVHLWRWDIEIVFGPPPTSPKPLTLRQFLRMVKNLPSESLEDKPDESVPGHVVSITGGRAPMDGTEGAVGPIEVFAANIRIEVQARVPLLSAIISGYAEPLASTITDNQNQISIPELFARPMQLTEKFGQSELVVSLKGPEGGEVALHAQPIVKGMPPALWGENVEKPDLGAPMISHVTGYTLTVRQNEPSPENLPRINMREFNTVDVGQSSNYSIPHIPPAEVLKGDDRFQVKAEILSKLNTTETTEKHNGQRQKRKDAVAAWDFFKQHCSGGGIGRDANQPLLIKLASTSTLR